MGLTINDICNKEFTSRNGGYDATEVDDFLNSIMDEMEAMQQQIADLSDELAQAHAQADAAGTGMENDAQTRELLATVDELRKQLAQKDADAASKQEELQAVATQLRRELDEARRGSGKAPVTHASETLESILTNAQKLADDAVEQARGRAKTIVEDAKTEADQILGNANGEKDMLAAQIESLKKSAGDYRAAFAAMLKKYSSMLEEDTFFQ